MVRVAVVTGATGGMGRATVSEFKSQGYEVVGTDRVGENSECEHFFQGEVCDEEMWKRLYKKIDDSYGKVDALVNIAGRNYLSPIEVAELSEWRDMFNVNVLGMVTSIKHLKVLLDKAGQPAIVNMSSISAHIGSIGYAAYCSTKGAIDSLTKSLALELAPKIRINAIAPGWIETPFTVEGLEKSDDPIQYRKDVEQMHALKRVGTAKEIAQSIFWMCSDKASFMTGSVVVVDGGYLIKN